MARPLPPLPWWANLHRVSATDWQLPPRGGAPGAPPTPFLGEFDSPSPSPRPVNDWHKGTVDLASGNWRSKAQQALEAKFPRRSLLPWDTLSVFQNSPTDFAQRATEAPHALQRIIEERVAQAPSAAISLNHPTLRAERRYHLRYGAPNWRELTQRELLPAMLRRRLRGATPRVRVPILPAVLLSLAQLLSLDRLAAPDPSWAEEKGYPLSLNWKGEMEGLGPLQSAFAKLFGWHELPSAKKDYSVEVPSRFPTSNVPFLKSTEGRGESPHQAWHRALYGAPGNPGFTPERVFYDPLDLKNEWTEPDGSFVPPGSQPINLLSRVPAWQQEKQRVGPAGPQGLPLK